MPVKGISFISIRDISKLGILYIDGLTCSLFTNNIEILITRIALIEMILDRIPTKSNIQYPLIMDLLPAIQRVLWMGNGTKISPAEIDGS